MKDLVSIVVRPNRSGPTDILRDYLYIVAFTVLLVATGVGLRDPWPADEPRFALIARDMLAFGEWLVPRIAGDVYADKPPLYFWAMASVVALTGSLRAAFLLPSFLGALGSVVLIYDLARRLWDRAVGVVAALALLLTVQFVWQARQAQIDALLCFWIVLGLYGLMRHLLLGPAWWAYYLGCLAAGLGVITKGVGFLPLLMLVPFAWLRSRGWGPAWSRAVDWRWFAGALVFLFPIASWLAALLLSAPRDPAIARYLEEILFTQTLTRYSDAWHHREPFWYFIVAVIPALWLPWIALVPWLWPRWRRAWQMRDMRIALPLLWTLLVVAFFSASSGKRGVYVLPAVPAFVLACAPYLYDLSRAKGAQRILYGLGVSMALVAGGVGTALALYASERHALALAYGIDPVPVLLTIGMSCAALCVVARRRAGFAAYSGCLACVLLIVSYWINPLLNDVRSGRAFVAQLLDRVSGSMQLGLVGYKEQYLLYVDRPVVTFGHARWAKAHEEAADAALWLATEPNRVLLVDDWVRQKCFATATSRFLAKANRRDWFLVSGSAEPACVANGQPAAIAYAPAQVRRFRDVR